MSTAEQLTSELAGKPVEYELIHHPRTESATEEAQILGVHPREVGKTIVVTGGTEGFVRVVVPASRRIDMSKIHALLGSHVRLATEAELAGAYPMFELGAVPPFGGSKDPVIVDTRIAERNSVVVEAGSHEESMRLSRPDLLWLTDPRIADVSCD